MKRIVSLIIIFSGIFLLSGCKNDHAFNDAKEKGITALNKKEPEKAEVYFETALEEKEDKTVSKLMSYAKEYQEIVTEYEAQKFDGLSKKIDSFLKQKLEDVNEPKEIAAIQNSLTKIETKKIELATVYTELQKKFDDKKYNEVKSGLDKAWKDGELSKEYFKTEFNQYKQLQSDNDEKLKEIQIKAEADKKRKEAEAAAKEAEEKLAAAAKTAEEATDSVVPADIQGTWYAAGAAAPAFTIDATYYTDEFTGKQYKITSTEINSSGMYIIAWDNKEFEERYGQGSVGEGSEPFMYTLDVDLSGSQPSAILMDRSGKRYIAK